LIDAEIIEKILETILTTKQHLSESLMRENRLSGIHGRLERRRCVRTPETPPKVAPLGVHIAGSIRAVNDSSAIRTEEGLVLPGLLFLGDWGFLLPGLSQAGTKAPSSCVFGSDPIVACPPS